MEKEKLISYISSNQAINSYPEILEWINATAENKEEYIRYKNLWALMQHGNDMPDAKILEALSNVRKKNNRMKQPLWYFNFLKYAAIVAIALSVGYLIRTEDFNNVIAMNEVSVPKGNRTSITLPDGTKAWLNNGTKLTYPAEFNGKNREVKLEGEGYFEVSHDKAHPFIVKIGDNQIKVLGTKFAVTAYPNDKFIKTELVSGQIQFDVKEGNQTNKFHSYLVNPSQSLVFDKSSGKISESKIADGFYNYWIKGVYQFKDETFEELAKKIERIYNVEVTFKDESLKKNLFSGIFKIDDNIYTLMEVFERATGEPFTYTHNGNRIYIELKK